MKRLGLIAALAPLLTLALLPGSATAEVTSQATPPFEIVMSGLDNPRGLAFGPEGALYVVEAGRGGTQPCGFVRGRDQFAGRTGAVSRLKSGVQERVASGFPSYAPASGIGAFGAHDIAFFGRGEAKVAIGLGNNPKFMYENCEPLGESFGWLGLMSASGTWRNFVDLAAHELEHNPDGFGEGDSNPYGLLMEPGATIVADGAGNTLLRVTPNREVATLAVFESRPHGRYTDSVPTTVVRAPDGSYYVGELTGVPYTPGQARIYRVVSGSAPTIVHRDLSFVIDMEFGPDGSLYVLQYATLTNLSGPGALIRIAPDGARSVVASAGLVTPTSVAIGEDGYIYISNCGAFPGTGGPGPCGPGGHVVRIPLPD